jgi:hypothetical protein
MTDAAEQARTEQPPSQEPRKPKQHTPRSEHKQLKEQATEAVLAKNGASGEQAPEHKQATKRETKRAYNILSGRAMQ